MRRLAASLFGRNDDKKSKKEPETVHPRPVKSNSLKGPRPPYLSAGTSNSSASSSTSFTIAVPDEGLPLQHSPSTPKRWKSVFRSRKGSQSAVNLPLRDVSTGVPAESKTLPSSVGRAMKPIVIDNTPAGFVDDDDEGLFSPPKRPFARSRSRTSDSASASGSLSSSRSSSASRLPAIPQSPPPVSPHLFMQSVVIRSLSRIVYTSPHPLLPASNLSSNNLSSPTYSANNQATVLFPRSVNPSKALPSTKLNFHQQVLRIHLLEKVKTYVFQPTEEREIARAISSARLSANSKNSHSSYPYSSQVPHPSPPNARASLARVAQASQQPLEITEVHRVEGMGMSHGLARWARRDGFEERMAEWKFDDVKGGLVRRPITGRPIAALEFSEGLEAFAGLNSDLGDALYRRSTASRKPFDSSGNT